MDEDNIITLNDENGNEVEFEFLDLIPYSHGVQSILSLPFPSLPSQKEKATGR